MENPRRETDNTKLQSKQDRNFKSCKSVSTRAYQKSSNTRSADLAAVWFAAFIPLAESWVSRPCGLLWVLFLV